MLQRPPATVHRLRVALVDDHPVVREGFRRLIAHDDDIEVVAEFGDIGAVNAALPELPKLGLDVLVLDLSLPQGNGFALLRRITARIPKLRVLVFTMFDSPELAQQCLRVGASGFVTKGTPPQDVVDAIRRCALGEVPLSPDVAHVLQLRQSRAPHALLSPQAMTIMLELIDGKSIETIAELMHLSAKTVANYQAQIRHVLQVDNTIGLLQYAKRHGIGSPYVS